MSAAPKVKQDLVLEAAISSVLSTTELGETSLCFGLIRQYLQNVVKEPKEEKYRQINTSNVNYIWKIGSVNGGTQIFQSLGFKQEILHGKEGSYPALMYKENDIERLNNACHKLQDMEEMLKEMIGRIPRKAILGQKKPSRAFLDFQGSTRFNVGFSDTIGQRQRMEDEIVILGMGPRCRKNEDYYAVFDGHGGSEASMFAAQELHKRLDKCLRLNGGDIIQALVKSFHELNHTMCQQKDMICGTCALVSYFSDNRIYIANLGDSRAVLGRRSRITRRITRDHKPTDQLELERIQKLGGYVQMQQKDFGRVMGTLSVSRALGDKNLKPYVSHDPDIFVMDMTENDYFLILACDGIWECVTDEEAVNLTFDSQDPQTASDAIVKAAGKKGSTDNASVITIFLRDRNQWIDNPNETIVEDVRVELPFEVTNVLFNNQSISLLNTPINSLATAGYEIVYSNRTENYSVINSNDSDTVRTTGKNLSNSRKKSQNNGPNNTDSFPKESSQEETSKEPEKTETKQFIHLKRSKSHDKEAIQQTLIIEPQRSTSARHVVLDPSKKRLSVKRDKGRRSSKKRSSRSPLPSPTVTRVNKKKNRSGKKEPEDDEPEDKEDSNDKIIKYKANEKLKNNSSKLSSSTPESSFIIPNSEELKKKHKQTKKKKKNEDTPGLFVRAKTAPEIEILNINNNNEKMKSKKTKASKTLDKNKKRKTVESNG